MHMIDTHQMVKDLVTVGIRKAHAESIVNMVYKSRDYDLSHLATKEQLKTVEVTLRKDIDLVRKEMEVLRADTKADISGLRAEIANVKTDILKWIVPLLVAIIAIVAKQAFHL